MKIPPLTIFSLGLAIHAAATLIPGCSKPAERKLTLVQYQGGQSIHAPFEIDMRGLPHDAMRSRTETDATGSPNTTIRLNMDYEFEIVVRLQRPQRRVRSSP